MAIEWALFIVVTLTFPVLALVAGAVDLVRWIASRKPFVAVRFLAFLWWYLLGSIRGELGLARLWIASRGRDTPARRRGVYRLRQQWMGGLLDGVRRLFGLRLEVDGLEEVAPGPVLILMRHTSIIDNTLPDAIIGRAHGLGLRFVLKRELQMIPPIDIGGRWVPTSFVRRASGDTARELEDLRLIGRDLSPEEGIILYPEGTRHTPEKLRRAQKIVAERQPHVAPLANRLRNVLPPRLGGALALLREARGIDVVFCGHVGFDGFEHVSDIWAGGLVGTTVRVRFWRHAADTVPVGEQALTEWLYEQWQALDDWVGEHAQF
jgi:1-acyl-sn-glycerol-3-phosphate acyltransferase